MLQREETCKAKFSLARPTGSALCFRDCLAKFDPAKEIQRNALMIRAMERNQAPGQSLKRVN